MIYVDGIIQEINNLVVQWNKNHTFNNDLIKIYSPWFSTNPVINKFEISKIWSLNLSKIF